MRFFDAHCDTIGAVGEGADFVSGQRGNAGGHGSRLHVTLPGLMAAGFGAQVFASWVWSQKYAGRELETGLAKVAAVRRLCEDHPDDLALALTGDQVARSFAPADLDSASAAKIAVIASLEAADPLQASVDNLDLFFDAGVRLITLAWGDNAFIGSAYGNGAGLTRLGADLVEACEEKHVLVDVSHASDKAFNEVCRLARRPFVASHSNCRTLCPHPRNLTDEMIRTVGETGGVMGVALAPGFLSRDFYEAEKPLSEAFFEEIRSGAASFEDAGRKCSTATASLPRPPLRLVVDHVLHAINVGGEDAVGLGGDLDGVDSLPAGFEGVEDYPRIAELLREAGLSESRIEKVCWGNFTRVFQEGLP
jgi:membrane dipeptidase